jgi:hypothetical protein
MSASATLERVPPCLPLWNRGHRIEEIGLRILEIRQELIVLRSPQEFGECCNGAKFSRCPRKVGAFVRHPFLQMVVR